MSTASENTVSASRPAAVINADFLRTVARRPGVYLMKDRAGRIIYVGKALDLRKRLASYRRSAVAAQGGKTAVMLNRVRSVDTIITGTEKEALILEAELIKKHKPRYNITLRDDKNYPLIKVTINEKWPRVMMSRRRLKDGARYFGPFSSAAAMWETLNYLNLAFPLRRCAGKTLKKRRRSCLNYQMGRCPAPCTGQADSEKYGEMVRNVLMILEGRRQQLCREIEDKMKTAAAALEFEEAALWRDRLAALRRTLEKQVVVANRLADQDIFGFCRQGMAVAVAIVFVRRGVVNGQRTFFLAEPVGDDAQVLAEVIQRYYGNEQPAPREIMLPFAVPGREALSGWLGDLRGGRVLLKVPRRGAALALLRMAAANARQIHSDLDKKARAWESLAANIHAALRLTRLPGRIECLDISNIGGAQAVGSLVCFQDGEKEKSAYRHYKIRDIQGPDDYGMMAEVLTRRFNNKDKIVEFAKFLPSLLVLDGGKGQLNIAVKILSDLGLRDVVELVAIAKEKETGQGEKLYRPGRKNPIVLPRHSPVLLFFMQIRDEAHRYGITFHRKWRQKATLQSQLDNIPGVGPVRKKALLKSLGSFRKIMAASADTLASVAGIGPELADHIWRYLHE